jgi:hypothetical protein
MPLERVLAAVANATSTAAQSNPVHPPANSTTAVAAVPAQLAPAAANSTVASGIVPAIQNFASGFATNMTAVTLTMDNAAIDIGKAAVIFLVIAGVLLWFSHVNKHLGKELLEGGIIIGLFIEFGVPVLMSIHL